MSIYIAHICVDSVLGKVCCRARKVHTQRAAHEHRHLRKLMIEDSRGHEYVTCHSKNTLFSNRVVFLSVCFEFF